MPQNITRIEVTLTLFYENMSHSREIHANLVDEAFFLDDHIPQDMVLLFQCTFSMKN